MSFLTIPIVYDIDWDLDMELKLLSMMNAITMDDIILEIAQILSPFNWN